MCVCVCVCVQCSFVVIYRNHPLKIIGLWLQTSIPLTGEYENLLIGIFMGGSQAIVTN